MHVRSLLLLMLVFGFLPGCLDSNRSPTLKESMNPAPVDRTKLDAVEAQLSSIESDLQRAAGLPPAERHAYESAMGPRLEQAVAAAAETRLENKAVYYLANWRFTYQEAVGVDQLLNQLAGLSSPALKSAGDRLRVMVRLRQGRVNEARGMAVQLVERIPEFSPVLDLVIFHETVGSVAPKVVSNNLTGGPDEPVSKRSEPWLFYLFIDALDDQALFLIQRYLDAMSILPVSDRRIVCVTYDANLLSATTRVRSLPRASEIDLLWANPNNGGNAGEWSKAWKLPAKNPHIALLGPGPNRTIMAVEMTPESLRALLSVGVPKATEAK